MRSTRQTHILRHLSTDNILGSSRTRSAGALYDCTRHPMDDVVKADEDEQARSWNNDHDDHDDDSDDGHEVDSCEGEEDDGSHGDEDDSSHGEERHCSNSGAIPIGENIIVTATRTIIKDPDTTQPQITNVVKSSSIIGTVSGDGFSAASPAKVRNTPSSMSGEDGSGSLFNSTARDAQNCKKVCSTSNDAQRSKRRTISTSDVDEQQPQSSPPMLTLTKSLSTDGPSMEYIETVAQSSELSPQLKVHEPPPYAAAFDSRAVSSNEARANGFEVSRRLMTSSSSSRSTQEMGSNLLQTAITTPSTATATSQGLTVSPEQLTWTPKRATRFSRDLAVRRSGTQQMEADTTNAVVKASKAPDEGIYQKALRSDASFTQVDIESDHPPFDEIPRPDGFLEMPELPRQHLRQGLTRHAYLGGWENSG